MPKSLRVTLLQESRADEGIYFPLIQALRKDNRFLLTVIHNHNILLTSDWLIVLGDRREMLEATIDAAYRNIPVAHIQGGDRTGTIDDPARHAITRFANLHFPCTEQSAQRLIRMGEEAWRVKVVGPLGIYAMPKAEFLSKQQICEKLGLDSKREIVLVIQHPVSTQVAQAGEQMRITLEAVKNYQSVVIYPNNDPGSEAMIKVIEQSGIKAFKNLPYLEFLSLLRASNVIVGNSSTGLYEAALFGIPAVNIGDRQENREHGENIWDCPLDSRLIKDAIVIHIGFRIEGSNPFMLLVDGVKIIMDIILETPINERLLQKRITY